MSGPLVTAVFDSSLPAWLKPYAAACASFATDSGDRVYPSIRRIARMVGKSERSAQRAMHQLRALGVLVQVEGPGHHRAPRYVLRAIALPQLGDPDQLQLFPQDTRKKPAPISGIHRFPQPLTGHPCRVMGDTGDARSVIDPSFIKRTARAREPRQTPKSKTGT